MSPRTLWEASDSKLIDNCASSAMPVGLKSMHVAENSSNLRMDWKSPKCVRKVENESCEKQSQECRDCLKMTRKVLRELAGTFWDTPNFPEMVFRNFHFRLFRDIFGDFQSISRFELFSAVCMDLRPTDITDAAHLSVYFGSEASQRARGYILRHSQHSWNGFSQLSLSTLQIHFYTKSLGSLQKFADSQRPDCDQRELKILSHQL